MSPALRHDIRWVGLVSMPLIGKTKRAVIELRDVTAQKTLDQHHCSHHHRTIRGAQVHAREWAADMNRLGIR